jgi:4'-phosphopantetheinyl transferase EntD
MLHLGRATELVLVRRLDQDALHRRTSQMVEDVHGMFDGNVVVLMSDISGADIDSLSAAEFSLVAQAVRKRQSEFATGRKLAREALRRFGVHDYELLSDSNRAPIWPRGFAGSVTHCATMAFVAIGRSNEVGTVGIDAEVASELAPELWSSVLTAEERAWVGAQHPSDRGKLALLMFSAKEALYKAQFPRTKTMLDFSDIGIDIDALAPASRRDGLFTCRYRRGVHTVEPGTVVAGRFRYLDARQIILTAVQMPD